MERARNARQRAAERREEWQATIQKAKDAETLARQLELENARSQKAAEARRRAAEYHNVLKDLETMCRESEVATVTAALNVFSLKKKLPLGLGGLGANVALNHRRLDANPAHPLNEAQQPEDDPGHRRERLASDPTAGSEEGSHSLPGRGGAAEGPRSKAAAEPWRPEAAARQMEDAGKVDPAVERQTLAQRTLEILWR
eukprot:gene8130-9661_t